IPVLSTISHAAGSGDITLASLLGDSRITDYCKAIVAINTLPAYSGGAGKVPLGSFRAQLGSAGLSIVSGSEQANNVTQEGGGSLATFLADLNPADMSFPVLSNPSQFFQLMVGLGQNLSLFTCNLPTYSPPPATFSQDLGMVPVFYGVSVDFRVSESISVAAGASFGCDASGLLSGQTAAGFYALNVGLTLP